jgi:glycolate oxidase iron-sulfur subunit
MLALDSCVQGALAPGIDAALARVLDRIGISLLRVPAAGCCGALPHHLSGEARALAIVKRNVDVWWPHVDRDVEAIVVTASGCGVMVKDYGRLLQHDRGYAERAQRISSLTRDPVEVIGAEWTRIAPTIAMDIGSERVAFHSPCSLQHGMGRRARRGDPAGARARAPARGRSHLCCGSAGTIRCCSRSFRASSRRKVEALERDGRTSSRPPASAVFAHLAGRRGGRPTIGSNCSMRGCWAASALPDK